MRYTILVLIFLGISTLSSVAQNTYSVKGIIADTASNTKLENASVSILNAKDSTLVTFTRAAADGSFNLNKLTKGKFILLVTYPDYADYVEDFSLDSAKTEVNFRQLNLTLKSTLLAEVIVKGRAAAIKIKGDTTEYNAAAFTIQPDSKVEDLLKQLPGIQVDKDGKITAQGETVNKVLVDGEEFFGDDPTLVTKNIRADMVDKVQLYDKKSDQATFTGIDDGQKAKTINIKLKEDKKNGSFGKADLGVATNKFYQGQLLFNTFRGKKKFSAYGTLANTGKTGLTWRDNTTYGGAANNMEFTDGGGMMIWYSGGDDDLDSFSGNYNGEGIPLARTGGVHYDSKWNNDKYSINVNYKVGSLAVDGTKNTLSQNNLPGQILNNTSDQIFNNFIFRQKADGMYQVKLDTTSNLKLTFDATFKNNESIGNYITTGRRGALGNDTLQNRSARDLNNKGDQSAFNAGILYTKKLKKVGRTISVNVASSFNKNNSAGTLKSVIEYFDRQGVLDSTVNIDQRKTTDLSSTVLNTNIAYTEPLSKSLSLVFNYGFGVNNSYADRKTFEQAAGTGAYNVLIDSLSSDYKLNQLSNQIGAIFNYRKGKSTINFGTKASAVNFEQKDLATNNNFKRNFINWFPQASMQYRFGQRTSAWMYYNGSTTQPSIDQIQPVRINNDPLNLTLGNPNLTPSFNNRFNFGYSSYKVLTDQYFSINGSYSFTTNPIVGNAVTDTSTGRSIYQSSNLAGKRPNNFYVGANFERKIKTGDLSVGFGLNTNGNTYYNLVNNEVNMTKSYTYSANFSVSKYKYLKYQFYVRFGPNYTTSEASLQKNINNNGKGFNSSGSFTYFLPWKFMISSDANYDFKAKTQSFDQDFSLFIWNASLTKSLMKENNLKLTLSANDLLNNNRGFSRSAYGNVISQTSYTNIKRYFMFSIVYDFNKMGGGKTN